jgi:hypothetical protein
MYTRPMFKKIIGAVTEAVASTTAGVINTILVNSTTLSYSARAIGNNFNVTIQATSGTISLYPDSTTVTQVYKLHEKESIDLRAVNFVGLLGGSTTAKAQAVFWED